MEFIVFREDSPKMGFHKGDPWKVRGNGYSDQWEIPKEMVVVKFPHHNQRKAKNKYLKGLWVDEHEILKRAYRFKKFPKNGRGILMKKWVERKW